MKGMFAFVPLLLFLAGAVGYIMNFISIVQSEINPLTGMLIARVIGVFIIPLGAILGFF